MMEREVVAMLAVMLLGPQSLAPQICSTAPAVVSSNHSRRS